MSVVESEQEKFPPEGWSPNSSLQEAIAKAARKNLRWWQWRKKRAIAQCLYRLDSRFVLEADLTRMALEKGQLPNPELPSAPYEIYGDVRIYVGSWLDLFNWIIENWDQILAMILAILDLFSGVDPVVVGSWAVALVSAGYTAQDLYQMLA